MSETLVMFLISLIPAILLCLFGYKLKNIALAIIWFLLGWFTADIFLVNLITDPNLFLVIKIATALILGVFSLNLAKMSVFLAMLAIGFAVVYTYCPHIWYFYIIGLIIGALLGVLGVYIRKPMLIFCTAYAGASTLATTAVTHFALAVNPYQLIITIALCVIGCAFQFYTCKSS